MRSSEETPQFLSASPSDVTLPLRLTNRGYKSGNDAKTRTISPPPSLPPLTRSHGQRPLGRMLIVRVEFVYTDDGPVAARNVSVRGDWNDWTEIAMTKEQGRTWSVITTVPTGYREFQFVVDGVPLTSTRHPTARGDNVNWRNVLGPVNQDMESSIAIHRWARSTLTRIGLVTEVDDENVTFCDQSSSDIMLPNTTGKPKKRIASCAGELGLTGFLVIALSAYMICIAFYALIFGQ